MARDRIIVRGAREHNLKNIDVDLPRDRFIVITGLSGSGKSSLAFDTIFAEGQRRYVESLSAYARQFLGQMDKPDVDYIEGLSPAISIDQKTSSRNPRSTVGTVTEIYDYLRLLYARTGHPHCHKCGKPISQQTVDQMVDQVLALPPGTRIQVLAPMVRGRKGEHTRVFADLRRLGYVRVRVDGQMRELEEQFDLDKKRNHTIEAIVDRLVVRDGIGSRLADSIERALELSGGLIIIDLVDEGRELSFSQNLACPDCGVSVEELTPRMFSFNSPYGACPECHGLGQRLELDPDLIVPDRRKSLADGAIAPWASSSTTYYAQLLQAVADHYDFSVDTPIADLTAEQVDAILQGTSHKIRFRYENRYGRSRTWDVRFEGVIRNLNRRYRESTSDAIREQIEEFMTATPCPGCEGARLRPESMAVLVGGQSIAAVTKMTIRCALNFLSALELTSRETQIARQILKELRARMSFLMDVGLDYLTIDRTAGTLAGGEAQRIRLATQIGSSLVGVLYILDEPSIGLHQRDNARLIETLKRLRDLGNTLIVVEHDEETIWACDHVIDIGPGAGREGGRIVAQGTPAEVARVEESITGQYLSGREEIPVPARRRQPNHKWITISGARAHNLKDVTARVPVGLFVCVTGVSGSGKSTLIDEILYRRLAMELHGARHKPAEHDHIEGLEYIDKVINIDQSPIGRTPRSNPATYTGVFDHIRELFSRTPEARARGYKPGRFSFNVRGGRCESCRGDGTIRIEMHFLPDVYVTCDVCHGRRYNRETMDIHYRGKTIADVLDMNVDEAVEFFANLPRIRRKLETLRDVGLGYIRIGQPATTLSGGEAQRVKLATELSRRSNGRTVYLLDEPTTGLHLADVHQLLLVLQRLVEAGDTVVVIEHNLDVIKTADWIIDLGPEGGDEGGRIVATGTPEELSAHPESHTGRYISLILDRARGRREMVAACGEVDAGETGRT